MAYAPQVRTRVQQYDGMFGKGINTYYSPFEIDSNELTDMQNMNGDKFPALSVRPARSVYSSNITQTPLVLGQRNNSQLQVVTNQSWAYWSTATSNYIAIHSTDWTRAKVIEFVRPSIRESIIASTFQVRSWDGTANSTELAQAPKTRFIAAHRDRLYALLDGQIKYCENRASTDWTGSGAGFVQIGNVKGADSGLVEYNDVVMAFTDQSIHLLYGSDPIDYQLENLSLDIGTVEDRTIQEVEHVLYFLDYKNVYAFSGGSPTPVGDKIKKYLNKLNFDQKHTFCSGSLGHKYFLSVVYDSASTSPNLLLEYNSQLKTWYAHDGNFIDFVKIKDGLVGLTSTGGVHNMESTGTQDPSGDISWHMVTKPFNDGSIQGRKALQDIWLTYQVATGGKIVVSYSTEPDGSNYTQLDSSTVVGTNLTVNSTVNNSRVLIPITTITNVPWYRIKINGEKISTIHNMQRNLRIKSR